MDSARLDHPRKIQSSHPRKQNRSTGQSQSLPCQRTKAQPQAPEGVRFSAVSDTQTNLFQMLSTQGSLLFVLQDHTGVTSSRKPSLTTYCGWLSYPCSSLCSNSLLTHLCPASGAAMLAQSSPHASIQCGPGTEYTAISDCGI